MKIGQPREMIAEAGGTGFPDSIQLKDGRNVHRIIHGPKKVQRVWWPTLVMEEGKPKQTMRVINRPEGGCIFDTLAALEKEAWRAMGDQDPSSQFSYVSQILYLAIDLADDLPVVKVAPYKWTIFQRLVQIQEAISDKDADFLMYGLIWMYPCIITKSVDQRMGARYGTRYAVDPHPENPWIGKIPVEWLKLSFEEIAAEIEAEGQESISSLFFTTKEWEAIENCSIDLEKVAKPNTEEEIINKLKENPIYLGATDRNSKKLIFPENMKQFIQSSGVPFMEETKHSTFPVKLDKPKEVAAPEPVEAEVVESTAKEESPLKKPTEEKKKEAPAKRPKWSLKDDGVK